jgi:prepilin-type N-terminal cleavage/methylation domain-containing protein
MPRDVFTSSGYTAIELIFVTALIAVLSSIAVPPMLAAVDDTRTIAAVRYLAGRFQRARTEAVTRSAVVSVRFTADAAGYSFAVYVDGNANGVLSTDIQHGIDRLLNRSERLSDNFPGVDVAVLPNVPAVDPDGPPPDGDALKLGSSNAASFSPQGTSSSGSVYIRGRGRSQYVIRLFGETGKTRVLRYNEATNQWSPL